MPSHGSSVGGKRAGMGDVELLQAAPPPGGAPHQRQYPRPDVGVHRCVDDRVDAGVAVG